MKNKDYLKLFVNHAKENQIWYAVCASGAIEYATEVIRGVDMYPDNFVEIGTKEAYEWLVKSHEAVIESEAS